MLRIFAITALSIVGAVSVANADVYRWVDDHGGVHYSDQWVQGSELVKSSGTRPHPDSDSSARTAQQKSLTAASDHASAENTQQNAAQAVKQDVAKAREQQCKEAKDRYEKAVQARRIYKPTPGDTKKPADTDRPENREYMSDEEADKYRVQARTDMQEFCGASAAKLSDNN